MDNMTTAVYGLLHSIACAEKGLHPPFTPSAIELPLVNALIDLGAITRNEDNVYHLTEAGQQKLILSTLSQMAAKVQALQAHSQKGSPMWGDLQEIGLGVALIFSLIEGE